MYVSLNVMLYFGLLLSLVWQISAKSIPLRQESDKQSLEFEIEGIKHVLDEDGIDIDKISALKSSPFQFTNMSGFTTVTLPVANEIKSETQNLTDDNPTSSSPLKSLLEDSSAIEKSYLLRNHSLENINKSQLAFLADDDDDIDITAIIHNLTLEQTTTSLLMQIQDDHETMQSSSEFSDQGNNEENATAFLNEQFLEETDSKLSKEYQNPMESDVVEFDHFKENQDITVDGNDDDDDAEEEEEEDDNVDEEHLPLALQNLPHDIPKDRTIAEVLAENTIKDKQFDELRIKELIHELMSHTLGFGEVYSDEPDYEIKDT